MSFLTKCQKDAILVTLSRALENQKMQMKFCEVMGDPRTNLTGDVRFYSDDIPTIMDDIENLELAIEHFQTV